MGPSAIYLHDLIFQTKVLEFITIGAKRIGLDDIHIAPDILPMDFLNEIGAAKVELVETGVEVETFAVEHGPGCTITQENPLAEDIGELSAYDVFLRSSCPHTSGL
jgi:hypothetical protein